ncbi:hypothetical protein KY290_036483 [Solanum tuberosum]|uniref:Uncharacterized protein n=1 Tax=Solanum tuberosum TaxID=4113 RepID=A0ABQ7TUS7_SOLTU|nr:hypothetical protein KY285_035785 [Solanum tuberosum]KAH0737778.1 hypothetical protein KY290_036483 [Solanum tuberosum]
MESHNHDLHSSKISCDSIVPIYRNRQAIFTRDVNESPEMCLQFRATCSKVREDSTTGDYSPHEKVQLIEISSQMDGGIAGKGNSGENRTPFAAVYEKSGSGNHSLPLDIHLSEVSSNLDGGNTNKNRSVQPTESMINLIKETSQKTMEIERNGTFQAPPIGHNIQMGPTHPAGARTIHVEGNSMQENNSNEQPANDQFNKR